MPPDQCKESHQPKPDPNSPRRQFYRGDGEAGPTHCSDPPVWRGRFEARNGRWYTVDACDGHCGPLHDPGRSSRTRTLSSKSDWHGFAPPAASHLRSVRSSASQAPATTPAVSATCCNASPPASPQREQILDADSDTAVAWHHRAANQHRPTNANRPTPSRGLRSLTINSGRRPQPRARAHRTGPAVGADRPTRPRATNTQPRPQRVRRRESGAKPGPAGCVTGPGW
jgi:hypothetical protein